MLLEIKGIKPSSEVLTYLDRLDHVEKCVGDKVLDHIIEVICMNRDVDERNRDIYRNALITYLADEQSDIDATYEEFDDE